MDINNRISLELFGKIANMKYDFFNGKLIINLQEDNRVEICNIEKCIIINEQDFFLEKNQEIIMTINRLKNKSIFHKKKDLCDIEIYLDGKMVIQIWLTKELPV